MLVEFETPGLDPSGEEDISLKEHLKTDVVYVALKQLQVRYFLHVLKRDTKRAIGIFLGFSGRLRHIFKGVHGPNKGFQRLSAWLHHN